MAVNTTFDHPIYNPRETEEKRDPVSRVNTLETMKQDIFDISHLVASGRLSDYENVLRMAQAATHLAAAWQTIKETDIHEAFHREQQNLPGEFGGSH